MAVAKSYENMTIIGEPFTKDGRLYVNVKSKCPRCGGSGHYSYNQIDGTRCYGCGGSGIQHLTIRWYTDKERAAIDKQAEKRAEAKEKRRAERETYIHSPEYHGFIDGFVIAILGNTYEIKDELKEAGAKFIRGLGWCFSSKEKVPSKYSDRTRMIMWEDASINGELKNIEELERLVAVASPYDNSIHPYMINTRVHDLHLKVIKAWNGDTYMMHTMVDENNNVYIWATSSRILPLDAQVIMDATIKDNTEYKGIKQTVLTRPRIKSIIENN